jgi:hypothetical protein
MVNKWVFIFLFFFPPLCGIFAQETLSGGSTYFIRQADEGAVIVQRLVWPGDEDDFRCEAVIEKREETPEGRFIEVYRESTQQNFIEISLGPGNYRYRLLVYNLLNQLEYTSNWAPFKILPAYQPKILRLSPDGFYLEEYRAREIVLEGRNLREDSRVFLKPLRDRDEPVVPRRVIIEASGESARLVFDSGDLVSGSYVVYIQNPGGLEDSKPFFIDLGKPFGVNIAAGYSPLLPLYGYLFDIFDDSFYPPGFDIRVSCILVKETWGYLGLEAVPYVNFLQAQKNGKDIDTRLSGIQINGLYKRWIETGRTSVNFRLGMGPAARGDFTYNSGATKNEASFTWMFALDTGVSFQWYIYSAAFVELGLDYERLLSKDSPEPGFLRPFAEIGWRF